MKEQNRYVTRGLAAVLVAGGILLALGPASQAWAQTSGVKQQIQQSAAANRQRLATYTWEEQQTVSLKGEVKSQNSYLVRMGPDGRPQKSPINAVARTAPGGVKGKIIQNKTNELKDYAQQIAALMQTYLPPNPERLKQAFDQGNGALTEAGPDLVRLEFAGYNQQGDTFVLVFNKATKGIQSAQVASYLNNDPSDAVTISAQFAKLPDGTSHLDSATVNGEKKHLTIQIQNTNYQKM